ncbi:MAG: SdiA-regulated domain-containing protein [Nitrospinota bacterium]
MAEPSGLAYDPERDALWVVSDEGGFGLISKEGKLLEWHELEGDLEGVALDARRGVLYIAEEQTRTLFRIHLTSGRRQALRLKLEGYRGPDNRGAEGLALDPERGHIFVAKERQPHFTLELDGEGRRVRRFEVPTVEDITGLCYDAVGRRLLILSRGSKQVIALSREGKPLGTVLRLDFRGAEGIALDPKGRVYIAVDNNLPWGNYMAVFPELLSEGRPSP